MKCIKPFENHTVETLWQETRTLSKFEAWVDLLQITNPSLEGEENGECIASLRDLGERWKWSKNKVFAFLLFLELKQVLGQKKDKKRTQKGQSKNVITIYNYMSYESTLESEKDTKRTKKGQKKDTNSSSLKEDSGGLPTSQKALRIAELFSRRTTTKWSEKEIRSFKSIPAEAMEDLELVCKYTENERLKGDNGRHRRDLLTFLNNFTGELDRAKAKPITGNGKTTSAAQYGI